MTRRGTSFQESNRWENYGSNTQLTMTDCQKISEMNPSQMLLLTVSGAVDSMAGRETDWLQPVYNYCLSGVACNAPRVTFPIKHVEFNKTNERLVNTCCFLLYCSFHSVVLLFNLPSTGADPILWQ